MPFLRSDRETAGHAGIELSIGDSILVNVLLNPVSSETTGICKCLLPTSFRRCTCARAAWLQATPRPRWVSSTLIAS